MTMVQDAEYNWKDEHDEDFPDVECIEESAVKDASAFVEAFQTSFGAEPRDFSRGRSASPT